MLILGMGIYIEITFLHIIFFFAIYIIYKLYHWYRLNYKII